MAALFFMNVLARELRCPCEDQNEREAIIAGSIAGIHNGTGVRSPTVREGSLTNGVWACIALQGCHSWWWGKPILPASFASTTLDKTSYLIDAVESSQASDAVGIANRGRRHYHAEDVSTNRSSH